MSFDPSFQYTQGIGAGAPDSTDITGTPAGVDPSEDPTKNEYYTQRLQTPPWIQAGFPDYQSYAANLRLKEEQARALTEKQINASSGASGATAAASNYATQERGREFDLQSQADAAKQSADQAHQAAVQALAEGNAAEAKRQFDISQNELTRSHNLDFQLRQQSQNLESSKFGQSVYDKLADLASNPRNFMEQFFRNRGQPAPPNAAQYGNTSITGPGLMSAQQFIPSFLGSLGLGGYPSASSGAGAPSPSQASAPSPSSQNAQGQSWQPGQVNPYAGTNTNYGGSPTTADTAMIGGVKTWAGGPYSGQAVASSPADAGDLTPYLKAGQAAGQARMMADGGSLHMTAPHAIVNLLSGKVAAIAGEQPGRGPQGFVPETAKFDGQAIIDPLKSSTTGEPLPPDGSVPKYTDPGIGKPLGDPLSSFLTDTTYGGDPARPPIPEMTGAPITPPAPPPQPPTSSSSGLTPELIAQARAAAAAANSALPAGAVGGSVAPVATPTSTPVAALAPVLPTPPIFGPAINPSGANLWGGPVTTPANPANPQATTPGFDFTQTPSGLGRNPTFLPENAAAQDPIVKAMIDAGSFPPFLQRLYAQAKGLPGLGTNVPQQTDLPAGVPLVSKLAYNQMSPSEQQAFASFLSAHGITIQDYLSMVEAASPQGGTSPANPAVPKFLSQGG